MGNKVLLCNTYFYPFDKKQWNIGQPYPPLGTLFAASTLREASYDIRFFDNCLNDNANAIETSIKAVKPDYLVIYDDGFNYLTKMCLTVMRDACITMINYAKKYNIPTIISSSDSTDHYGMYLSSGADYILLGEGEETLVELLDVLDQKKRPAEVLGIAYLNDQGIVCKNDRRPVKKQLDDLPIPAWDLVDFKAYRSIWEENHGYFSLNLGTTRGCPYKCNWCAKPIYGNRYNSRSPENVINEIEYLQSLTEVSYFWMCDDIFGLKPNWVQTFLKVKEERKLTFRYKIQSRVDLMLKDDNLIALVDSGLDTAWLGAESGSQKILDAMDKGTDVSQIYTATRALKSKGVKVAFFLQFGYLDETWSDIKETLKMVLDLMPDEIGISVSYPLPGTKFYEKVKDQLQGKANWSDSNDLDLMFENTFKPAFYKTLHKYVHNRYNVKKGWLSFKGLFRGKFEGAFKNILKMGLHIPLSIYRHIQLLIRTNSENRQVNLQLDES